MNESELTHEVYVCIGKRFSEKTGKLNLCWTQVVDGKIEEDSYSWWDKMTGFQLGGIYETTGTGPGKVYRSGEHAPKFKGPWADAGKILDWQLADKEAYARI